MTPVFVHDCSRCKYLGTYSEILTAYSAMDPLHIERDTKYFDLYCCDHYYRSIIVRCGNEGCDYCSFPEEAIKQFLSGSFEQDPGLEMRALYEAYYRSQKVKYSFRVWRRHFMKRFGRFSNFLSRKERLKMIIVELLTLVDIAIFFCSLTTYQTDFHCKFLFSDILEDE